MNTAVANPRKDIDVMSIALFAAAAVHAILLLGVSFHPFLENLRTPPALEVVLVQQSDLEEIDDAAYLAQSNQDGGGETDDNTRPSSPFTSALDVDTEGVTSTPTAASAPKATTATADDVITALNSEDEVVTGDTSESAESTTKPEADIAIEQNADIARLAAEIDRQQEEFAKRPKKKFLNARTREAASAEYMFGWVESVERMGNLNYPDEARRNKLRGELILIVGIFKNGELESVTVDESSGHKILDDAAVRIVQMAAPFAPMTGQLAEETDILYIVRTWEFTANNSVDSR